MESRQISEGSHNLNYAAQHVGAPKRPWPLLGVFAGVGVITVCNLNAIGANMLGISQLFSPIILLLCVAGWFWSKGNLTSLARTPIWPFFLAVTFYLMLGFASGMGQRDLRLIPPTFSIIASLLILATISSVTLALVAKGQTGALLMICYFLSLMATLSVFIPVVYPAWQQLMQTQDETRASGFFANPNEAGVAILYFIAFAFSIASYRKQPIWIMAAIPVAAAAVFYTYSRSSILAMCFLIGTLSFLVFPIRRVVLSGGAIILAISIMFFMRSYIEEASRNDRDFTSTQLHRMRLFNELLEGRIDSETTGGRSELAAWTFAEWQRSPFVGHGLSSFSGGKNRLGSHNTFLMVLGEVGIVGLIPFAIAWFVLLKTVVRQKQRWLLVLGIGIFMAVSLGGLASHNMLVRRDGMFVLAVSFAMIAGCSLAGRRRVSIPWQLSSVATANQAAKRRVGSEN